MKNDKIISGQIVRKNPEHKGMWDIIETRAGQSTGKASFTGTMKEVRDAIKEGNRLIKAHGL
jgi:endonuclease IV